MLDMKRREFITLIGGAAAWPLAAHAQQPAVPVIGILFGGSQRAEPFRLAAIQRGLNATGFVEARIVAIEGRFALRQVQQRRNGSVQSSNRSRTACIRNNCPRPGGHERNGYVAGPFSADLNDTGYRNRRTAWRCQGGPSCRSSASKCRQRTSSRAKSRSHKKPSGRSPTSRHRGQNPARRNSTSRPHSP